MSFKDVLAKDLANVFFNPQEFGTMHSVEGKKIICIVDNYYAKTKSNKTLYDHELAEADFILLARITELPERKEAGELLNLDGQELTVSKWTEQGGVATIALLTTETA